MNAPPNPFTQNPRYVDPMVVWYSPDPSSNPTAANEVDWLRVIEVSLSAGGHKLDTCTLQVDVGELDRYAQNITVGKTFQGRVIIWLPDDDGQVLDEFGNEVGTMLFWGEIGEQAIKIMPEGEAQVLTARVEPRHFGDVVLGETLLNVGGMTTYVSNDRDLVINPKIDHKITGNRSQDVSGPTFVFLDPESARTIYSIAANGGNDVDFWTMPQITHHLLYFWNPETFIRNPTQAAVAAAMGTGPAIRAFKVKRGEYLPKTLDQLLGPHGYGWYLKRNDDPTIRWQIAVFRYGEGPQTQIYLQSPGSILDVSKSTAPKIDVTYNLADLANRIEVRGALKQRQITIECVKGWATADDDIDADDLGKGKERYPDSLYESDDTKRDVWRKWPANEGGDYTGFRTEITTTPDLRSVFGLETLPKRRKLHECLALDPDLVRRHVYPEWFNPDADDGPGWEAFPEHWSWHVLQHEGGIYFNGATPPAELMDLGSDARVRLTGTMYGDSRVSATATRRATSPNAADVTLYLDCHDTFFDRQVQTTGTYASQLTSTNGYDEKDDTTAIQTFAEAGRDQEDSARISATFELHGIHPEYQIGQLVTKIEGRNISLNRNSTDQATARYLQIIGITHNDQEQKTALHVETLELKKTDLDTGVIF